MIECGFVCVCVCGTLFRCLSSLAVSVCRQGAPALAPNQPASCVHSALPLAAGKLVPAICHTAPHTLLTCVLLFVPLREASMCVDPYVRVRAHTADANLFIFSREKVIKRAHTLYFSNHLEFHKANTAWSSFKSTDEFRRCSNSTAPFQSCVSDGPFYPILFFQKGLCCDQTVVKEGFVRLPHDKKPQNTTMGVTLVLQFCCILIFH